MEQTVKKSEKLPSLKKSVDISLERAGRTAPDVFLRSVSSSVGERLKDALTDFYPRIEKLHEVESGKSVLFTAIHYTGIDVLVSMLQSVATGTGDSLRMYDSVHLNDPAEGNYIASKLPKEYAWLKKKDVSHAYIASFITPDSQEKAEDASNNLVFWRTYGKEGQGCSLSFRVPRNRLKMVRYGSKAVEDTMRVLKPVLDLLDPLINIPERTLREKVRETLGKIVWNSLERFSYLYKSEAYAYEKECRIVLAGTDVDKDKIRFELQGGKNSPAYIRHYYADKDLAATELLVSGSSITLGPCVAYPRNMVYCLETIKRKADLAGPEIKISTIPYTERNSPTSYAFAK